jgi:hypothetical protein
MTIGSLRYNWQIAKTIRKAARNNAISQDEAGYLNAMAKTSLPASSTTDLIAQNGAPDFLYAALYFSTMIWQSNESAGHYANAQAGYKLAQFALLRESPGHEPYWATKLLRDFYDAHCESTRNAVAS